MLMLTVGRRISVATDSRTGKAENILVELDEGDHDPFRLFRDLVPHCP
jgi:hypothetical protein